MDKLDQIDQRALLLKRGTRLLAKACGGNDAAGDICGRSGETVRRWADPAVPETIPAYFVALLEAECGQPVVTRMLAEMAGQSLRPQKGEPVDGCMASAHAEAMIAQARLTQVVVAAKSDGIITKNEADAIARAGVEAQARVGHLLKVTREGKTGRARREEPESCELGLDAGTLRVVKPVERA